MRIAFVWDWNPEYIVSTLWSDGLAAALRVLSTRHELKVFCPGTLDNTIGNHYVPIHERVDLIGAVKEFGADAIIVWADRTRPNIPGLAKLGKPMFMCFSGGEITDGNFKYFQHFFVENEVYKKAFERLGRKTTIAFGCNTDLFKPLPDQQKVFDVIFPAHFAMWKQHRLWASAVEGLRSCAVGFMSNGTYEDQCWQDCEKVGSLVLPYSSGRAISRLLAASKVCCITSDASGGSQRTVLEAMAMNIPLVVADHSDKTSEYLLEAGQGMVVMPDKKRIRDAIEEMMTKTVNTRDYVLSKWTHNHYADAIEKELLKI